MDREMVLDLARRLRVPITEAEAADIAPNLAITVRQLEQMKSLPLEGVEPPQWFAADRLRHHSD